MTTDSLGNPATLHDPASAAARQLAPPSYPAGAGARFQSASP